MSVTISIPQSQVYTALGNFIMSVLGLTAPFVVQNFDNRVPMPNGPFVGMSTILMKRLRTNRLDAGRTKPDYADVRARHAG